MKLVKKPIVYPCSFCGDNGIGGWSNGAYGMSINFCKDCKIDKKQFEEIFYMCQESNTFREQFCYLRDHALDDNGKEWVKLAVKKIGDKIESELKKKEAKERKNREIIKKEIDKW